MSKTGTYYQVYTQLSDDEKRGIVDGLMQYLNKKRQGFCFEIRGAHGLGFRIPQYMLGSRPDPEVTGLIMSCSEPDVIWERIWKPSLVKNKVSEDECEFLRRTMPIDHSFTYTQLNVFSSNILVQDGRFSGFVSDTFAGYFPPWLQHAALSMGHYPLTEGQAMEGEEAFHGQMTGHVDWYRQLGEWFRHSKNEDNPLANSVWGLHSISAQDMDYGRLWFDHWFLIQELVQEGRDCSELQDYRRDITILVGYLKGKQPGCADKAEFFNYVKERRR